MTFYLFKQYFFLYTAVRPGQILSCPMNDGVVAIQETTRSWGFYFKNKDKWRRYLAAAVWFCVFKHILLGKI